MKIAEIKEKLYQGDCSEEVLDAFLTTLKRVPRYNRCQHCYTTAASMPTAYHKQAIELIECGLEFCEHWIHRMRSYNNMAYIYENIGDYKSAHKCYENALLSVDEDNRASYTSDFATSMMITQMHINGFKYSEELLRYYEAAFSGDSFHHGFKKVRFYRLLAEIIIFRENGDIKSAKKAYSMANHILNPDYADPITDMLKRHKYTESVGATKEAIAFLKRVKWFLAVRPIQL